MTNKNKLKIINDISSLSKLEQRELYIFLRNKIEKKDKVKKCLS